MYLKSNMFSIIRVKKMQNWIFTLRQNVNIKFYTVKGSDNQAKRRNGREDSIFKQSIMLQIHHGGTIFASCKRFSTKIS